MKELERARTRQHILALLAIVVAFAITGCATTISQPPFQEFTDSLQKVRTGADNALGALYDQTRARYIDNTAQGGAALEAAQLTTAPNDRFAWTPANPSVPPPLYLTEARFRDGLYRLNSSLVDYATALVQLSSPDLLNPETFNTLATDLNNNLNKALPALGVQAPAQGVAIFSAAATTAFRLYLQNKQRSALADAISTNQGAIQGTADLGRSATEITVRAVANEYALRSQALASEIQRAGASESDKRAKAKNLIDLNDAFIKDIGILRALHQSYVDLPAAHADLAATVGDPKVGIGAIRRLYEQGRELERLYEQLIKQNTSK
jgi:hypothetical protein